MIETAIVVLPEMTPANSALTHDSECTGECNLKIKKFIETWLLIYQMKEQEDIHHTNQKIIAEI